MKIFAFQLLIFFYKPEQITATVAARQLFMNYDLDIPDLVPPPVSVKASEGTKPFVEVSLIVRLSDFSDLKHVKLCQVI